MKLQVLLIATFVALCTAQWDPNTDNPGGSMVHLFEWTWNKIAQECEEFLGPMGYASVQTSPVSESARLSNQRPWWDRYQPVCYQNNYNSPGGDEASLVDMIHRCNNAGVKIYPDIVVNHMTGNSGGNGWGGSSYDYGSGSYPCVAYGSNDFNSDCSICCYDDANNVRNCRLVGLIDLNQGSSYVRQMIADFMNDLISKGVAGFRMDACKHMWPGDLEVIFGMLNDLNTDYFPAGTRPFIFQEVIDGGGEAVTSAEYEHLGRVTEFGYGGIVSDCFMGSNGQKLSYLSNFGESWGILASGSAVAFIDNHDNQRTDSSILTYKSSRLYKMAVGYMLAWDYGVTRVMSSFAFDDTDQGPPNTGSPNYYTVSPNIVDNVCDNGWVCEHRWSQIYSMAKFRDVVSGTSVENWWSNDNNQISFSRGNKGFAAFNNDNYDLTQTLQTGLPAGTYCDVISGEKSGSSCTGKSTTVNSDGTAYIELLTSESDGLYAIHEQSKL